MILCSWEAFPVAVRLPIFWVVICPLPSSSGLNSTYFKVNIEKDNELSRQVKSWYDMQSLAADNFGLMYRNALRILERKFGQPHASYVLTWIN